MRLLVTIFKTGAFLLFTGLVALSCSNRKKNDEKQPAEPPIPASALSFTDSKLGDTSLIFIHGWNIDKSYWQSQVDFFSAAYRVVTIDLPGFGESPAMKTACSAEQFASEINQLATALQLKNRILVGHSMSGAVITEITTQSPGNILAMVGIDNFTAYDTGYSKETKQQLAAFFTGMRKNYSQIVKPYTQNYLLSPSTDSIVKNRVLKSMLRPDSVFAVDCLEKIDAYPLGKKLKYLNRPLYLINSDFHPNDTSSFRKNGIELHFYNIGPTGHYPMIEKPAEFNRLLQSIIYSVSKNTR
ncbi:MAG: alpha/beta hydrolase [Ferruginibacter sp.]